MSQARGLSQRLVSTGVIGSGVTSSLRMVIGSSPAGPAGRAACPASRAPPSRAPRRAGRRAASRAPPSCPPPRRPGPGRSRPAPARRSAGPVSGAPRVGNGRSPPAQRVDQLLGRLDGLVVEVLVVDLQHRREVAGGQALGVLQRDRPRRARLTRRLLVPDPELRRRQPVVDRVAAQRRAQGVRADADQVLAARRALVHRVERRDRRHLGRGQLQHLGAVADAVLADVALHRLHEVQQRQQGRPRLRVPRDDLRGALPGDLVEDRRQRRLLGDDGLPLDLVGRRSRSPDRARLSGCPSGVVIGPHLP